MSSASAAIDVALSDLIRRARLRHDVEAYGAVPPTYQEVALSGVLPDRSDLGTTLTGTRSGPPEVTPPVVRRGEIWLAELDKRCPVLVLTRDPLGRVLHSVEI